MKIIYQQLKTLTTGNLNVINLRIFYQIEVGRFTNISRKDRLCNICNSNSIDDHDETHFLITCRKYDHQKKEIYQLIKSKRPNFSALDEKQKLLVTQY